MPLLQETRDEIDALDLIERIERLEEIVDAVVENMLVIIKEIKSLEQPEKLIVPSQIIGDSK